VRRLGDILGVVETRLVRGEPEEEGTQSLKQMLTFGLVLLSLALAQRQFFTFHVASKVSALDAGDVADASRWAACDGISEVMPRVRIELRNAFATDNMDMSSRIRISLVGRECDSPAMVGAAGWSASFPERGDARLTPFSFDDAALPGTIRANDSLLLTRLLSQPEPELCELDCVRLRVRANDDVVPPANVSATIAAISAVVSVWSVNYTIIPVVGRNLNLANHRWPEDQAWRTAVPGEWLTQPGPLLPHVVNSTVPNPPLAQRGILAVRSVNVEACASVSLRTLYESSGSASLTLYWNGAMIFCSAANEALCADVQADNRATVVGDAGTAVLRNLTLASATIFVPPSLNRRDSNGAQVLAARVWSAVPFDVQIDVDRSSCTEPAAVVVLPQYLSSAAPTAWKFAKAPYRSVGFNGAVPSLLRGASFLDGTNATMASIVGFANASATALDMAVVVTTLEASAIRRPDCSRVRLVVHGSFPLLVLVNGRNVICVAFDDCERELPRSVVSGQPARVNENRVVEIGTAPTLRITLFTIEAQLRDTQLFLVAPDFSSQLECSGSCTDGIKNGIEDLVDCGGVCSPCMLSGQMLPPPPPPTPTLPPLSPGETRAPTPQPAPTPVPTAAAVSTMPATAPTTANVVADAAPPADSTVAIVLGALFGLTLLALIVLIVLFVRKNKNTSNDGGGGGGGSVGVPMQQRQASVGVYGKSPVATIKSDSSTDTQYQNMSMDPIDAQGLYVAPPVASFR
jgi:hypothetical protein